VSKPIRCTDIEAVSYEYFKRLVASFPPRRPGFDPRSGYLGFVVDKVALREVFSDYFGFSMQILIPPTALHSLIIVSSTLYNQVTNSVIKKPT
jgi:hypothetical protein